MGRVEQRCIALVVAAVAAACRLFKRRAVEHLYGAPVVVMTPHCCRAAAAAVTLTRRTPSMTPNVSCVTRERFKATRSWLINSQRASLGPTSWEREQLRGSRVDGGGGWHRAPEAAWWGVKRQVPLENVGRCPPSPAFALYHSAKRGALGARHGLDAHPAFTTDHAGLQARGRRARCDQADEALGREVHMRDGRAGLPQHLR